MRSFNIDCITRVDVEAAASSGGVDRAHVPGNYQDLAGGELSSQSWSPTNSRSSNSLLSCNLRREGERLPDPSDQYGMEPSITTDSTAETLLLPDKSTMNGNVGSAVNKPPHSYIALISMAILSRPDRRMLLGDIYQYIMDNFRFYNNNEKAWRNSIRHNLSLNECFIKNGRADNGKGNFWSVHPACGEDFSRGDFRRRQARRRARKCLKEKNFHSMMPSPYNFGYVPMTQSHIGYSPYGSSSMPWYYPQSSSSMTSFPQASTKLISPISPVSGGGNPHSHSMSTNAFFSPCSLNTSQQNMGMPAVAQQFLSDQAMPTQFPSLPFESHLATGMQIPSW